MELKYTLLFVLSSVVFNNVIAIQGSFLKTVYYVKPTSNSTQCPQDGLPCHVLSYYTQNVSKFFASNVTMIFLSGQHSLAITVKVESVQKFIITGITNELISAVNEYPLPKSVIQCVSPGKEMTNGGWYFLNVSGLTINNLEFNGCGEKVSRYEGAPIQGALILEEVSEVVISGVTVNKSFGVGLHVKNAMGNVSVFGSVFLGSIYSGSCSYNARFIYYQCKGEYVKTLTINSSHFLNNTIPGLSSSSIDHYNATGLDIILYCASIPVTIVNVTASHNLGGNVGILINVLQNNSSTVLITDSEISYGVAKFGGGLQFWSRVVAVNSTEVCKTISTHTTLNITRTNFTNNNARKSGGAVYISHYSQVKLDYTPTKVSFTQCVFDHNYVLPFGSGAAMTVIKFQLLGYTNILSQQQFEVSFEECVFTKNYIKQKGRVDIKHSILKLLNVERAVISNSNFTENLGSAVALQISGLILQDSVLFRKNHAYYGGALRFCEASHMYIRNNSNITFESNSAINAGGAIYVQKTCLDVAPSCFFQPIVPEFTVVENLTMQLLFINNSAHNAGDAVYGGSVDNCYMINKFLTRNISDEYKSKEIFSTIFNTSKQTGNSVVSSDPLMVCFSNSSGQPNCSMHTLYYPRNVYAGQNFSILACTVGQRDGVVPASIRSSILNDDIQLDSYSQIEQNRNACTNLTLKLFSNRSKAIANISLTIQTFTPSITLPSYFTIPPSNVIVTLQPCPWGFEINKHGKCDCLLPLMFKNVSCDIDAQTLQVQTTDYRIWIGNNNKNKLIYSQCIQSNCKKSTLNISKASLDNQCASNRTGILCTICEVNYSHVFGTTNCHQCTHQYAPLVLLVCLLAGILLIIFITALNLTVTEGTINGLLFYANVIRANSDAFFPVDNSHHRLTYDIFRLFIAWLNLDMDIEVCFFKGMDNYQKAWLHIAFVFYLWFLLLIIIYLSHRFVFFTRLVGRNAVKVMATMFLLSYTIMIKVSIHSAMFRRLRNADESVYKWVWLFDGNVQYIQGKHLILFIFTQFLFCILVFFTLALLFIQCLQRGTKYRVLKWIDRLRPFFEAYTGPCHTNYRFWPGLLLLLRILLFSLEGYLFSRLLLTMATCIFVLILACVSPRGVYKKWPLNILEFTFFFNITISLGYMIFYKGSPRHFKHITYPSVAVAMVTFVIVILYHVYARAKNCQPCTNCFMQISTWISKRKQPTGSGQENSGQDENEYAPLLQQMSHVARFDQYREPLLSEN